MNTADEVYSKAFSNCRTLYGTNESLRNKGMTVQHIPEGDTEYDELMKGFDLNGAIEGIRPSRDRDLATVVRKALAVGASADLTKNNAWKKCPSAKNKAWHGPYEISIAMMALQARNARVGGDNSRIPAYDLLKVARYKEINPSTLNGPQILLDKDGKAVKTKKKYAKTATAKRLDEFRQHMTRKSFYFKDVCEYLEKTMLVGPKVASMKSETVVAKPDRDEKLRGIYQGNLFLEMLSFGKTTTMVSHLNGIAYNMDNREKHMLIVAGFNKMKKICYKTVKGTKYFGEWFPTRTHYDLFSIDGAEPRTTLKFGNCDYSGCDHRRDIVSKMVTRILARAIQREHENKQVAEENKMWSLIDYYNSIIACVWANKEMKEVLGLLPSGESNTGLYQGMYNKLNAMTARLYLSDALRKLKTAGPTTYKKRFCKMFEIDSKNFDEKTEWAIENCLSLDHFFGDDSTLVEFVPSRVIAKIIMNNVGAKIKVETTNADINSKIDEKGQCYDGIKFTKGCTVCWTIDGAPTIFQCRSVNDIAYKIKSVMNDKMDYIVRLRQLMKEAGVNKYATDLVKRAMRFIDPNIDTKRSNEYDPHENRPRYEREVRTGDKEMIPCQATLDREACEIYIEEGKYEQTAMECITTNKAKLIKKMFHAKDLMVKENVADIRKDPFLNWLFEVYD